MPILLSMKPIENFNLRDWSCTRRINGQIRLKENRWIYAENWKWELDSPRQVAQELTSNESVAKKQIEPDNWEWMSCQCNSRGILLLSASFWLKFRIYKARWIPWPMQENFFDLETGSSSGASHIPSQPLIVSSPRGMLSRDSGLPLDTRKNMVTSGNVFESQPAREGPSSAFFENSKNLASSSSDLGPRNSMEHGKGVRRDPQSSSTPTPRFDQGLGTLNSWRNLFSVWCDGLPEISDLGTASWKIHGLIRISKLECLLQDWKMCKFSTPSSHDALGQRTRDSQTSRRSCDIAVDYRTERFHRLRWAWYYDCVCIAEASHACALPKKS